MRIMKSVKIMEKWNHLKHVLEKMIRKGHSEMLSPFKKMSKADAFFCVAIFMIALLVNVHFATCHF